MTEFKASEWLATRGYTAGEIAGQQAAADQVYAWIAAVAPVAQMAHLAAKAGDWDACAHYSEHVAGFIVELGVAVESPAAGVITALLNDVAMFADRVHEFEGHEQP